jgi:hypothetical protein
MKFVRALHIEDADVRVLASNAPKVPPLALPLKFLSTLVLPGGKIFHLLGLNSLGNAHRHGYVKQHFAPLACLLACLSRSGGRYGAVAGHFVQQGERVLRRRLLVLACDELAVDHDTRIVWRNPGVDRTGFFQDRLRKVRD